MSDVDGLIERLAEMSLNIDAYGQPGWGARVREAADALAAERDRADRAESALKQGTDCVCDPAIVISDGPNTDCPKHGEATA